MELTTKELHNLIHEGYIDLNPPYQRGQFFNEPAFCYEPKRKSLLKIPFGEETSKVHLLNQFSRTTTFPP